MLSPSRIVEEKKDVVSDEQSEEFHVFPETKKLSRSNKEADRSERRKLS